MRTPFLAGFTGELCKLAFELELPNAAASPRAARVRAPKAEAPIPPMPKGWKSKGIGSVDASGAGGSVVSMPKGGAPSGELFGGKPAQPTRNAAAKRDLANAPANYTPPQIMTPTQRIGAGPRANQAGSATIDDINKARRTVDWAGYGKPVAVAGVSSQPPAPAKKKGGASAPAGAAKPAPVAQQPAPQTNNSFLGNVHDYWKDTFRGSQDTFFGPLFSGNTRAPTAGIPQPKKSPRRSKPSNPYLANVPDA